MKLIHLKNIPQVPASHEDSNNPGVLKQILFRKDDIPKGTIQMINWSTLLPGKTFQNHYHEAMDEIFIILNGSVNITVNNEVEKLTKGDAVVVPANLEHTMTNLGDTPIQYIAIGSIAGEGGRTVVVKKKS